MQAKHSTRLGTSAARTLVILTGSRRSASIQLSPVLPWGRLRSHRIDLRKTTHRRMDVQEGPVTGDPVLHRHADRRQQTRPSPDAEPLLAHARVDTQLLQGRTQTAPASARGSRPPTNRCGPAPRSGKYRAGRARAIRILRRGRPSVRPIVRAVAARPSSGYGPASRCVRP